MAKEFKSPCNDSELMFLEQLAKEHPKDIKLSYTQGDKSKKLEIEITSKEVKEYVIWMLERFRSVKSSMQSVFDIVDWEYADS